MNKNTATILLDIYMVYVDIQIIQCEYKNIISSEKSLISKTIELSELNTQLLKAVNEVISSCESLVKNK